MTKFTNIVGETITVRSIVECTVRYGPTAHFGWGIVEELYDETPARVAEARVRDVSGRVANYPLVYLRLHHKIPQP